MMKKIWMLATIGWLGMTASWAQSETCVPARLQCDYLESPLGIDNPNPRLSWKLDDVRKSAKQTAYQVWVGTDSLQVVHERGNMWDSKKQSSDNTLQMYAGQELAPFTKYFWKVKVWDKDGIPSVSKVSSFETGMMSMKNWQGAWIGDGHGIDYKPAPYFRKVFQTKKKIKSARAYLVAAGLFELYLNGEKIGNHRLDPLYTRFDRKNFYLTFDVTKYLQEGKNAIGVLLGNGWFNHQSIATWNFHEAAWRNRPAFCMDLRITYDDGTVEVITSDRDWKTSGGALVFNSIYTAEHYDARLEQKGWNAVNFDDSKWKGVRYRQAPSNQIVSQQVQPIRAVEDIKPQKVTQLNDTTYVFHLARNMTGTSRI
jgi:alpha-L-rhamnosidase